MVVYCVGCLLSVLMTWLVLRVKHNNEGWRYKFAICFFASLPLMMIAALRYYVGQDYGAYVRVFIKATEGYRQPGIEFTFYEFNRLIHIVGGDFTWLFGICSFLFCMFVFSQIIEDSPYPILSVFLLVTAGYYFSFFNTMRQLVGCAILLYSIRFVKKRDLVKFGVCVAFASCLHFACLLFIPVYFLYGKTISRRVVIIVTATVFLLATPLSNLIIKIVSWSSYSHYLGGVFDTSERGYTSLVIAVVQIIFATVYYDEEDKDYTFYYNLQIIALWLLAFVGKVVLISRIRWMFSLSTVIFLPIVLSKVKRKNDRLIITVAMVILYAIYFYYTIGVNNNYNVLPYQTLFSR